MTATPTPDAERRRGYARWQGERGAQGWRWWVIARGNLTLALSNVWVKAILIASLIPGVILAGITYFFLPLSAPALDAVMDFSAVFAFLVAAVVGARLVSDDRRQGAFLAHFARPVTRIDYMVGKFLALFIPIFFVTTVPSLFGIVADASVDSTTVAQRIQDEFGDIPDEQGLLRQASYTGALGAIFWFGVIMAATTSCIVLGISALTTRARIAGVIWFAVVAFGQAAHGILQETLDEDWSALLSWLDGLWDISSFLVGLENDPSQGRILEFDLVTRVLVLAGVAAVGLVVVHEQLRRAEGGVK